MNILITGGLGYIGKITAKELHKAGHTVFIADSKTRMIDEKLRKYCKKIYTNVDVTGEFSIGALIIINAIDVIVHLAGEISVAESETNPLKYYTNNVVGSNFVLNSAVEKGVKKVVFASSASVYGINFDEDTTAFGESFTKRPMNVYARTKDITERMILDYNKAYGLKYNILRFFNVAGADLDGEFGEDHAVETHIIPNAILQDTFTINGNEYGTKDGTCERDYVHVVDLARAIRLSVESDASDIFNVGSGVKYSNLEILNKVSEHMGVEKQVVYGPRRSGDPDVLYSDVEKIKDKLGFVTEHSDIDTIIKTAIKWHLK